MNKRDYYEVLGITKSADAKEIKKAFRRLAMQYHPDRSKASDAEDKFKEINEAYEVLSNPEKRSVYDQYGHEGLNTNGAPGGFGGFQGFGGFGDIFSDLFGGNNRGRSNGPMQGRDYQSEISINFLNSILGISIVRNLPKYEVCNTCHGTKAQSSSDIIRCDKCNGSGQVTRIMSTPFGKIQQKSLCSKCEGKGSYIKHKCKTCSGEGIVVTKKEVEIEIPAGINQGQIIVVEGFGGPGTNGGRNGDLHLVIDVIPHNHFTRDENNIHLKLPVSIKDVIIGATINVPTPYGDKQIKISKRNKNN
jgi:molecular chaperone DnaJ